MSRDINLIACTNCANRLVKWAIVASIVLGVFKVATGILSQSIGVTIDGIQSFGCALVAIFVALAMKLRKKPADSGFPYGYGKAEFFVEQSQNTGLEGDRMIISMAFANRHEHVIEFNSCRKMFSKRN